MDYPESFLIGSRLERSIVYIAMNRFRINEGFEAAFEQQWEQRKSRLDAVPGYQEFHLLRGATDEGITLFASHVVWDSQKSFVDWTESEAFRLAHAKARMPEGVMAGSPHFEGFEVVL